MLTKIAIKPGIVADVTKYSGEGNWVDGDKVRFRLGFPEKIGGWRKYSMNTYDGVARSLHQWFTNIGNRYMSIGTAAKLYVEYSGTIYDVTPAGYTPGIDSQVLGDGWGVGSWGRGTWGSGIGSLNPTQILTIWSQDNFGQQLLACPTLQPIYMWDPALGTTSNPAVPISGMVGANSVPLLAGSIFVTDDRHVVALQTNDFGSNTLDRMLVRWCAQENYLDWEPRTDNTAGSQRLGIGSYLIAECKTRSETLIWSDKAVYSMQFEGPPYTFGFILISDSISIVSQQAAVNARNSIYWMDLNNFWMYNGSVLPLECPVRAKIFDDFNLNQRQKVFGGLNSQFNEVWWHYPSASSSECDRYVIYNFLTGDWSIGTLDRTAWLDLALDGRPVGANGGNLYQHEQGTDDDTSPMTAYVESGDLDIGDGEQFYFIRRLIPDVKFLGDSSTGIRIMLKQRNHPGDDLVTKADVVVYPGTEQRNTRVRGRQAVLRVESDGLGVGWRHGSTRLDIQPDGRR